VQIMLEIQYRKEQSEMTNDERRDLLTRLAYLRASVSSCGPDIKQWLNNVLNLRSQPTVRSRATKNGYIYIITWTAKNDVMNLLDFVWYHGVERYLKRKFDCVAPMRELCV
jgi:hypothetical protein